MQSRKVKYYPISTDNSSEIRKNQICDALKPVLHNKLKARTDKEPGLKFKVMKLNKVAKNLEIDRILAIFRHYLAL